MAAWDEPPQRHAFRLAFCIYVGAILCLAAWILYRVALPMHELIP